MRISDWSSDVCSSDLATGEMVEDTLITPDGGVIFANPRIDTRHTHGTGCTLSSAIATGLGQGLPLERAVERGIAFVHAAITHRSEEHTSELQSLMRISYAVFCLKKKKRQK